MGAKLCRWCKSQTIPGATHCRSCGKRVVGKSSIVALFLALFLGPVGFWYKGLWGTGFAWLVFLLLVAPLTAGLGLLVCWPLMALHAFGCDIAD